MAGVVLINCQNIDLSIVYDPGEHWGNQLARFGAECTVLLAEDRPTFEDIAPYSHVIVSGSAQSAAGDQDNPPWLPALQTLMCEVIEHNKPMLASCFGHQVLARTLGEASHVRAAAQPELGWYTMRTLNNDPLLGAADSRYSCFVSHFDEVIDFPKGTVPLAQSAQCAVHGFRLKDKPVWSLQSHPEITPAQGKTLLENMRQRVPQERMPYVEAALLQTPNESDMMARLLPAFLALP